MSPIESMPSGNERPRGITFEKLIDAWHSLKEGEEKEFIVATARGLPLRRSVEGIDRAYVLLNIVAEPVHDVDDNLNAVRTGTSYKAYEYVTDLNEWQFLDATSDNRYFSQNVDKSQTYIPVADFVRSIKPKDRPEPTVASPIESDDAPNAQPEPVPQKRFADLLPSERLARETLETSRAYLATTAPYLRALQDAQHGNRIYDPLLWRFVRTHDARFNNTGIVSTLDEAAAGTEFRDRLVTRGIVITESISTLRGKNLSGPVENPEKTGKLLTIRFLQKTRDMGPNDIVTQIGEEQAQDIAAVQYEIARLSEQDSAFAHALRKHGFEQVRLEDVSWRTRPEIGGRYRIIVLFEGNLVGPEK